MYNPFIKYNVVLFGLNTVYITHTMYSYRAFDFATRLDAAGFIRPKIKISLPVGRGARAERGSYEACTKKERFYKLQEWPCYLLSL